MNTLDKFNEALPVFNYSVLSDEEKLKTLENEKRLDEIFNKYRPEIGEVLYDQQQVLANHHKGVFAEWYKSKGFKRWKVYDYINKYKYVLRISEDPEKLEMFDDIPSSLQSEMAKPSAIPEVNQKVFEGDITAHKDYKEIEMHYQQQLKQKDELIESMADSMHDFELHAKELADENETLKNRKPEVIEKKIVIEKAPDDYEYLKARNQEVEKQLTRLTSDLKLKQMQYDLLKSDTAEAKEIKAQIDSLKDEQSNLLKAIQATKDLHQLEREFNEFFDKHMAPMKFKGISQYIGATNAPERIHKLINLAEAWVEEMRYAIPNQNIKIIEGEIIDG